MQMKKRVLSVLLALCLAGSLASTAWAAGDKATPETAEADPAAVVLNEEEEQQDETTVSQEETSGEDSTAAPAEDPVAQVTETEADDGSVEYTAALETDGQTMNVVVTAPEGAFAESVQPELSVTMLTAEDELNAVADKLTTAEVQYDGFTALDITFTDKATGEEIEPVQQVSVRIELPQAIVDSGIDLNTLAVQHLEEDADGNVQNVTEVATLDNGITLSEEAAAAANEAAGVAPMSDMPAEEATAGDAAETPAAVAEFEVDGFSSFVITWGSGRSQGKVEVVLWDSSNNREIDIDDQNLSGVPLDPGESYTVADLQNYIEKYVPEIEGYNYKNTTIGRYRVLGGEWTDEQEFRSVSYNNYRYRYTVNGIEWDFGRTPTIRINYTEIPQPIPMFRGEDTADIIDIDLYNYTYKQNPNDRSGDINFVKNAQGDYTYRPFQFSYNPNNEYHGEYDDDNKYYSSVNQGIVNKDLGTDDYPTLENGDSSLSYLFGDADVSSDAAVEGKKIYNDVNYLFQINDDGYYYYDSTQNFATVMLDENGQSYQENEQHSNDIWLYGSKDKGIAYPDQAFMPFNTLNGTQNNPKIDGTDYHFGMTVGFDFLMPENGTVKGANGEDQDMIFSFAGDDDVWVFIDGKLVLDIGGIHGSKGGSINFATGKVEVDGVQDKNIWTLLGYDNESEWRQNWTLDTHELKFFYFERGSGSSNCKIEFNLAAVPKDSVAVSKRVVGDAPEETTSYTMRLVIDNLEEVQESTPEFNYDDVTWNVQNGQDQEEKPLGENQTFTVAAGQTVYLNNIPANARYHIEELNVGDARVTINGQNKTPTGDGTTAVSNTYSISETKAVAVTNTFPVQPPEGFGITTEKTAVRQEDDPSQYELSLSMTGDRDHDDPEATPVDVLFIVDRSGSMSEAIDPKNGDNTQKIEAVRTAIAAMVDELETQKDAGQLDPRYSVVGFAGAQEYFGHDYHYYGTSVLLDWNTNNAHSTGQQVKTAVNKMAVSGGTNWDAAVQKGIDQLSKIKAQEPERDAEQIVIFLSDGVPTYGGLNDSIGNGSDTGYDSNVKGSKDAAVESIKNMQCDRFYAVGIGPDFAADEDGYGYMNELRNAVPNATTDIISAQSTETLKNKFKDIAESLTFFSCVDVEMVDQLSEWADLSQQQGAVTFTVQVEEYDSDTQKYKAIGDPQIVTAGTAATFDKTKYSGLEETVVITPSVSYQDGQKPTIVVTLAGADGAEYETEPGLRYTVKTMITPSQLAKDEFAEKEEAAYEDVPEKDTGTHAESSENGFYSNNVTNAKVNYNVKSSTDDIDTKIPGSEPFPKPVIRVQPQTGDLTITKSVAWTNTDETTSVTDTQFKFTITTTTDVVDKQPEDGYSILVNGNESNNKAMFQQNRDKYSAEVTVTGTGSVTIQDLPFATYTVEETSAPDVSDFYCASTQYGNQSEANNASLPLNEENTAQSITVTNTYAKYRTVTVIKNVTGEMGDTSRFFEFTAQIGTTDVSQKNIQTVQEETAQVTDDGAFKLKDDGSVTIAKVRQDATLTISETSVANEGYTTKHTIDGNTLQSNVATVTPEMLGESDVTVSFENYRPVVAPTGLESNHTTPYTLMVTAAGIAGLALIGGIVAARRRRRRME